ncbi:MAG TPA: FtsX-like permease family protein [Acidimicrobiales bacterium]|nr:FtsX-like permease family protein [Acidimicrobiales bacterium]
MGRILLVARLAARDLRRRPAEAALLLLAITAATTTLTLGLVLHEVASDPYQRTREATAGPDVVAIASDNYENRSADLTSLEALADAPGVADHSGPYPVVGAVLDAQGQLATAQVQGRDPAAAAVDQPNLTDGSWVDDGGAVIEAAFADALGLRAGDQITLNGRSFRVVGVAVTAAVAPYPSMNPPGTFENPLQYCPLPSPSPCDRPQAGFDPELETALRRVDSEHPGLVWLTQTDARSLAQETELNYVLNLELDDPAQAPAFVNAHLPSGPVIGADVPSLRSWQQIRDQIAADLARNEQKVLLIGSRLLALLAVASVAVLVGGRMADQTRRVGLLKAVGGTPSLVAAVLLAEYVVVALLAATAGLTAGWLTAPLLTDLGAGLLGRAGAPSVTLSSVGLVTALALGVAVAATVVPAVRAARTSTVHALADSARAPRRTAWLIAISARLPVPLLLGLRVAARRPRRVLLGAASIAITVAGIVAALAARVDAYLAEDRGSGIQEEGLDQALLVMTITLVALAAVNAIFITWATALDAKHSSALARALGATPNQVATGLSAAQVLPALAGAILGIPGGLALIATVSSDGTANPPLWQLLAVVPVTVLVVTALTTIPARLGARRPAAETLQAELA